MNRTRVCLAVVLLATISICAAAQSKQITYGTVRYVPPNDPQLFYATNCEACHGSGFDGRGPAASLITPAPSDLRFIAKRNNGEFPHFAVEDKIAGRGHHQSGEIKGQMPTWEPVLDSAYDHQKALSMMAIHNLANLLASHQQQ